MMSDLARIEELIGALSGALDLLNPDPELCGELSESERSWHATLHRAQHHLAERRGQCPLPFPELEDDHHD